MTGVTTAAPGLRELLDRDAIQATMFRFGRALDTRDWPLYRACLTDPVRIDFSDLTGAPARTVAADDWTRFAAACLDPIRAHHQTTNMQVDIEGDHATGVFYMAARHHRPGSRGDSGYLQLGWYDADLIRDDAAWRVRKLR